MVKTELKKGMDMMRNCVNSSMIGRAFNNTTLGKLVEISSENWHGRHKEPLLDDFLLQHNLESYQYVSGFNLLGISNENDRRLKWANRFSGFFAGLSIPIMYKLFGNLPFAVGFGVTTTFVTDKLFYTGNMYKHIVKKYGFKKVNDLIRKQEVYIDDLFDVTTPCKKV